MLLGHSTPERCVPRPERTEFDMSLQARPALVEVPESGSDPPSHAGLSTYITEYSQM